MKIECHGKISRQPVRELMLLASAIVCFSIVIALVIYFLSIRGKDQSQLSDMVIPSPVGPPPSASRLVKFQPIARQTIHLNVKPEGMARIRKKRDQALKANLLIASDEDFVPARLTFNDREYRVKIRLKGDLSDHWRGKKWSFRIKLKGETALFGMRKFSIQGPHTRGYLAEWLFHRWLKAEGLISLRFEFVRVVLNGKDMGTYALEEHFDKILIENNHRREGPIVKFNESRHWAFGHSNPPVIHDTSYFSSQVDAFEMKRILASDKLKKQFEKAIALLEGFRANRLTASDAFDIDQFAMYFALSDLLGGQHNVYNNLRFYYNPVLDKLEPMGFDSRAENNNQIIDIAGVIRQFTPLAALSFGKRLFSDEPFLAAYLRCLELVSKPGYMEGMILSMQKEINENKSFLKTEGGDLGLLFTSLTKNRKIIRQSLHPINGLLAYVKRREKDGHVILHVANRQHWPLSLGELRLGDDKIADVGPLRLVGKDPAVPISYAHADLGTLPEFPDASELTVTYTIPGLDRIYEDAVFPWKPGVTFDDEQAISSSDGLEKLPDFIHAQGSMLIFSSGKHTLQKSLIIPAGHRLVIPSRTTIVLKEGASIISYSPIEANGTADGHVQIISPDETGGVVVLKTGKNRSVLEYVIFDGLTNPTCFRNEFTGAVTFYESPVSIGHCAFLRNQSEDGLNIVRSEFSLKYSRFHETKSDAVDIDFCSGNIVETTFTDSGNDAVDLSGSVVQLTRLSIVNAGDKGVSVGENSRVSLESSSLENAKIGVASKDMSEFYVTDCRISKCPVGAAVYQKKPEYYGSNLIVSRVTMSKNDAPYLVEKGSVLIVDRKRVLGVKQKLVHLLYGEELGSDKKR